MPSMRADWIIPDWPAPAQVRALSTTRTGGVSVGVYASFNLGEHVGDAPAAVAENRRRLLTTPGLDMEPCWLRQVHGARVLHLNGGAPAEPADGAVTQSRAEACVIMAADCLPVLFCDRVGTTVAATHAGWRGMSAGVLEATVAAMAVDRKSVV